MAIKRQISDPQGWADALAAQHFREAKAVVEAATGRLPQNPPIRLLGTGATPSGLANKLNEVINRLQEDPPSPLVDTVLDGDGDATHVWLGTGEFGASPAPGSLAIGTPITSGTVTRILYEDDSNLLGESANLTFDTGTGALRVGSAGSGFKGSGSDLVFLIGGAEAWRITSTLDLTGKVVASGSGTGAARAIRGSPGGASSGDGGVLTLAGGTVVDGNGGQIIVTASAGAGTNKNGADAIVRASANTGAGTPGNVNLQVKGGTTNLRINGTTQHTSHMGTTPTLTSGGGGTGAAIAGTDESFIVTIGTTIATLTFKVTFANAFTNAPVVPMPCSDTDIVAFKVTTTTTTVDVTAAGNFTAGSKLHVICRGYE